MRSSGGYYLEYDTWCISKGLCALRQYFFKWNLFEFLLLKARAIFRSIETQ